MDVMIPIDTLLTFIATATLLAFVPGPDNLFVLAQSALFGPRVGIYVTAGLCIGLVVHTIAVSLGAAAIFRTSRVAFDVIKYMGALYLVYLAWKSIAARSGDSRFIPDLRKPAWPMFMRGVVMNVTNPKVAIFFLAFLPQFTNPSRGNVIIQMLMLGGLFIGCTLGSFATISVLAGSLSKWLRVSPTRHAWLNRIAGIIFIGLAVKLVSTHQ